MRGLAAIVARSPGPAADKVEAMLAADPHRGDERVITSIGACTIGISDLDGRNEATLAADDTLAVAFAGTLDNADELAVRFGSAPERAPLPADVVLADRHTELSDSAGAPLVCTFEAHAIGGGLVASETTAQAAIGLTDYVGRADGPAVRLGSDVGTVVAGFSAVQAILAWLH